MKKKYFGGYLSLRQMLYLIVSVISIGVLFINIPVIIKTMIFIITISIFIMFAFFKIGNIYADKYFINIIRYIFRKKIYVFER